MIPQISIPRSTNREPDEFPFDLIGELQNKIRHKESTTLIPQTKAPDSMRCGICERLSKNYANGMQSSKPDKSKKKGRENLGYDKVWSWGWSSLTSSRSSSLLNMIWSLVLNSIWGRMFRRCNLTLLTGSYGSISSKKVWLELNWNGSISWKELTFIPRKTWLLLSTANTNIMMTSLQPVLNFKACLWVLAWASNIMPRNGKILQEESSLLCLIERW